MNTVFFGELMNGLRQAVPYRAVGAEAGTCSCMGPLLLLVEAGELTGSTGENISSVGRGKLMLIPLGMKCILRWGGGVKALCLCPDGEEGLEMEDRPGRGPSVIRIYPESYVTRWELRPLLLRLERCGSLDWEGKTQLKQALLRELQLLLKLGAQEELRRPDPTRDELSHKAKHYMQQHYTNPSLNINLLADELHVSRSHLSRVFRERTDTGIHEYLTELRLRHCREALSQGKSVLTACTESGFSDYSSFLKTFRHAYGITPNAYRKSLAGAGEE